MIRDSISIRFPAQKQYMMLLRMHVAGAAAAYDLGVDMLDDLRMAAEEAYDYLLSGVLAPDTQLLCDLYRDETNAVSLHLRLSDRNGQVSKDQEQDIAYAILKTLVNDVTLFSDAKGGTGVRMMLKAEK